jgi:molybdopterin-guanine dinucleotide biosynthesis protein A
MHKKITAAILAGGPAKRLKGVVKPNLMMGGKTIMDRSVSVLGNLFREIIIVTNSPEEFSDFSGCLIVGDSIKGIGPLGGIHSALKAASGDAVFIVAGDMPFLSSEIIQRQTALYSEAECDILVPVIGSNIEPLHSIYSRELLKKLEDYLTSGGSRAVRDFYQVANVKFMELDNTMNHIFFNINTPSDIIEIERILKSGEYKNL